MPKPTILIADDDADLTELLVTRCKHAGFAVDTATNAMTALGKIEEFRPDVVILDVEMPHGNGLGVCEMMAGHEELCAIPTIILTGDTCEETIRRCHDLLAYYVLKIPDVWSRIEPVLLELFPEMKDATAELSQDNNGENPCETESMMDTVFDLLDAGKNASLIEDPSKEISPPKHQPWILLIEDDSDMALALKLRLNQSGFQVLRASTGREGYRRAFLDSPSAIILDYRLPEGNGDYVLRRLEETPSTCEIPVIVLTGQKDTHVERQVRGLGAKEFLNKPIEWQKLRAALETLLPAGACS